MKNLVLVILIACSMNAFGQSESHTSQTVAAKFESFYNNGRYDSIFAMQSTEMQKALPLEKTIAFLTDLNAQAGAIAKRTFMKYEASYASYKTNFERALFTLNISVDANSKINGFSVNPYIDERLPKMKRNSTKLKLPFRDEWTVIWGGDTKELNYHVENIAQKNAFDILITDDKGQSFKTNGKTNEDYYAFGKELVAPCDAEIVMAVDGVKDNKPGEENRYFVTGNSVILKTTNNEYMVFAHFKQNSIRVKEGQKVKQGQLLGLCGNSGNSSEPHLHFHIQNVENMNVATGVKCYFDKLIVNGQVKSDYSPVQGEKIKNEL